MENIILIVEDNDDNIVLYEDMFECDNISAKPVLVKTGEEAMRRVIETRPVLILMDVRLPGIDGLQATRLLKNNPQTSHIPVWVVTAYATPEDEEKARAAGSSAYFAKPVHPRALSDRIRAFVSALPEAAMQPRR
jgi:two-component system, cell cycle response regulator DivK